MANLVNYLQENGNKSFEEMPLNDLDYVLLVLTSYFDFSQDFKEGIKFGEMIDSFFAKKNYKTFRLGLILPKSFSKMLLCLKDCSRFKDLEVLDFYDRLDEETQFRVLALRLEKPYIIFSGTDDSVIGWVENFENFYRFPTISQTLALAYTNKMIEKYGPLYLGVTQKVVT